MKNYSKCDVCSTGKGWFDYPCVLCTNNPKSNDELLQEITPLIKTQDLCSSNRYKSSGNTAPCAYCKGEKLIDLIIGDTIEKDVIKVNESQFRYCPGCGRKLDYDY
ncbi:MAG: hypothetical protein K0R50_1277 [Eubacterium sp.]|jgi:hypothetical protein|nr:hypothetical protein [Eubacterium sp.]